MYLRVLKCLPVAVILLMTTCSSSRVYAQTSTGGAQLSNAVNLNAFETSVLDINLKGPDGQPVAVTAVVTLLKLSNEAYRQETAKTGHVRFNSIGATEYSIQVVASGYATTVRKVETRNNEVKSLTIELQKLSLEDAAENLAYHALAPKAQKEIGKALELLRAQKVADARSHLDAANRASPNQGEVQYLYGVYEKQTGNAEQAKSYWLKAVEYSPNHLLALISLADAMLRENRETEALPYAKRAVEAEPTSWRAHAILSNVYLRKGSADEAEKEAQRAMELGHDQAAMVQPVLAAALARKGERARAITTLQAYLAERPADAEAKKLLENLQLRTVSGKSVVKDDSKARAVATLQEYVQEHPSDADAKKLLDKLQLQAASVTDVPDEAGIDATEDVPLSLDTASALTLRSSWLPPDVDEKVPPVEQGANCALEDVLLKTGKQVQEFVKNVERFSATEFLKQEAIDKWGMSGATETRKFDYVVAVEEPRPGFLAVEEYRNSGGLPGEFPGGIATNGLPVLALIFHPYNAVNFEMTCEGLTRWDGKPAWQVHFRQRRDKPNTVRSYRLGMDGPSYPVALKGRAWILADSYEIARLETDLIAPVPQIKLVADHTAIEYGPVQFRTHGVEMWLPQSAEVYYGWLGKRIHRRHSFSNYMLFAVDEKQQIADPKAAN
ncbi:MAG TPA: tetratricopeptide repeat protein [Candidatus Acidoferrum sp.]|nr:tetratricopeptide repeat protein [Candidatus Acidoferrum sp.]